MNFDSLNNPGWHALNSHHSYLAIRGDISARYPNDVLMGAAMAEYNQAGFDDLRSIVAEGEVVGFFIESLPENLQGWRVLFSGRIPQMVCEDLKPNAQVEAVELTLEDAPEMLALIAVAQPGPFLPRTVELGGYLGVRQDGKLVAMAGQRIHLSGFCEISAVCTHPDYRGRGYGGALSTMVARNILDRSEIPFLHHDPANHGARRLYEKLGFYQRSELTVAMVKKTP